MAGVAGSQPSNLAKPIPGASEQAAVQASQTAEPDLSDLFQGASAQASTPSAPVAAASQAEPDISDLFGGAGSQTEMMSPEEDMRGNMANPVASLVAQAQELPTRFKASFATTDKEKEAVLKDRYGKDGVKKAKDGWLIKKEGEKWKKFDSDNFEILNDLVDMSRPAIEQGAAGLGTAGTAVAAGLADVATAGANVPATPAEIVAGRAIGGVVGKMTADKIAQDMLGIPRDAGRSEAIELATAAGGQVLGGKAGDMINGFIGKTIAKRAARAAAEKFVPGEEVAKNAVQDVVDLAGRVKDSGLMGNIPGTNSPISAANAAADVINPNLQAQASDIMKTKLGQGYVQEQQKLMGDAIDKIRGSITNITKGAADEELPQGIGASFKNASDTVEAAWGKLIGGFRTKAKDVAQQVDTTGLTTKVKELGEQMGFSRDGDKLIVPTLEDASASLGLPETDVKPLMENIRRLQENLYNGGNKLSFRELEKQYNTLGVIVDKTKNSPNWRSFLELKNAARDDMTAGLGSILGDADKKAYQDSLSRFSSIKSSVKDLGALMDHDEVTPKVLTKAIFSEGQGGLTKINAARNLIEPENPELWQRMKANYLDQVIQDAKGNPAKIAQKISNLGEAGLQAISNTGEFSSKQIKEFGMLADKINRTTADALSKGDKGALLRLISIAKHPLSGSVHAVANLLGGLGDGEVQAFFSKDGVNELLAIAPKKDGAFIKGLGKAMANITQMTTRDLASRNIPPALQPSLPNEQPDALPGQ